MTGAIDQRPLDTAPRPVGQGRRTKTRQGQWAGSSLTALQMNGAPVYPDVALAVAWPLPRTVIGEAIACAWSGLQIVPVRLSSRRANQVARSTSAETLFVSYKGIDIHLKSRIRRCRGQSRRCVGLWIGASGCKRPVLLQLSFESLSHPMTYRLISHHSWAESHSPRNNRVCIYSKDGYQLSHRSSADTRTNRYGQRTVHSLRRMAKHRP